MFENLSEKLERSVKILKGEGKITEINVAEGNPVIASVDGVVYSAFVSLGFALWENVGYVFSYGVDHDYYNGVRAVINLKI